MQRAFGLAMGAMLLGLFSACSGEAEPDEPSDSPIDEADAASDRGEAGVADASRDAGKDGDVECCPVGPLSCHGTPTGGAKTGEYCPEIADVAPVPGNWTERIDQYGCPVLEPGRQSCLGPPPGYEDPWDATDAGDAGDAEEDDDAAGDAEGGDGDVEAAADR